MQADQPEPRPIQRFRWLVHGMPNDAIAILSADCRVTDWNGAATLVTGYEAQEAKGQTLAWLRAQSEPTTGALDTILPGVPVSGGFAEWRRRADGGRYWCEGTRFQLLDSRGRVRGYAKCFRDASRTKLIEEELRRSQTHVSEVEHLMQVGSWEWDLATDHVTWSDGLFRIYGIDPAEFEPHCSPSAERVHPEDRERLDATVAGAVKSGDSIDVGYRILRPDGRIRRVHALAEVIFNEDGTPLRLAGVAQDVTDAPADASLRGFATLQRESAHARAPHATRRAQNLEQLTPRQLEILQLIADGYRNGEIAHRLYLTEGTVKWHVRQILQALRVANRAEAAARLIASRQAN